ncbi:MAG: hypothetical protein LQ347_006672, partial [Umbilicaria vellea]
MGKFTQKISKIARGIRRASAVTIEVIFAHPDADRSSEIPSFYLVPTSPTSCQQRYITPRSSALISNTSTGTLVIRNPDPSPPRSLRTADELLPDGKITAESFELQITDEEADNEPDQEEFGDNVEEASPQPEPRASPPEILWDPSLAAEFFPNTAAELNSSTFGYRYEAIKRRQRLPRLEIPSVTSVTQEVLGNRSKDVKVHRELESLPTSSRHFFSKGLPPSPFERQATEIHLSRNQRPQLVMIPAVRSGRFLPESLRVPVRALTQEELMAIRKADFQLFSTTPLAQRLTGGLDHKKALAELNHKKALAELNHGFTRVSKADVQLIPRKPLAERLTGGVAYRKALADLKHRRGRSEVPVTPPSHKVHDPSWRQSTTIPELPAETISSLPALWSTTTNSRRLVVRAGTTVTFDGAYHTYMHHRRQTRHQRYLEMVLGGWGWKFEKKTTLAQEISEALAVLGNDMKL